MSEYKDNLWKVFIYTLTQRRSFIPILSVFFLTLPNATAKQIGFYTAAGYLTSFLFEIPSGYFSDHFGYKKTLIISKLALILSVLCFAFATGFWFFAIGSILMSLGFSLNSGTREAFVHGTLRKLNRDKDFSKVMIKMSANAALLSMFLILGLPLLTKINLRLPFQIYLLVDLIGLLIAFSFKDLNRTIKHEEKKSVFELIKLVKSTNFFPIAIFTGGIIGFAFAHGPFKWVYLESVGLPIIFIGASMALSRFLWFLIGQKIHLIEEKLSVRQHLFFELFFFPLYYLLLAFFSNIYFLIILMAIVSGYMWGRNQIIKHYLIKEVLNSKYKATYLSLQNQISAIFQFSLVFLIGFVMNTSFKLGFLILGIGLFVVLLISYLFLGK